MEKELTIVTAFFKINRDNRFGFRRTEQEYFEYFKLWAKLKNKIIVYIETEELRDSIIDFRSKLGLTDRTIVNVIKNFVEIDPELYRVISEATNNPIQQLYRLKNNNPESRHPNYNYIGIIKPWCVCDAINRGQASGMITWLDFGYNHGGHPVDPKSHFSYTWKYDFPDKVNVFSLQELDNRPIFDIIFSMDTYIVGGTIIAPDFLWNQYWNLMRKCTLELSACGLADDEQNVILMALRKCPQIFEIHRSGWSMQLKDFGGAHLMLAPVKRQNIVQKTIKPVMHRLKKIYMCIKQAHRIYKHMVKVEIH